jgi:hypothetical protein
MRNDNGPMQFIQEDCAIDRDCVDSSLKLEKTGIGSRQLSFISIERAFTSTVPSHGVKKAVERENIGPGRTAEGYRSYDAG